MRLGLPDRLKQSRIPAVDLLVYGTLALIVVLFLAIRLIPLKWGIYLNDFDPYINYKAALYIVQHGLSAWYTWFDPTRWYPWGTFPAQDLGAGVPFTGAIVYFLLDFMGFHVPLLDVAVFLPVVFAGLFYCQ